jgi:hypothetical protein
MNRKNCYKNIEKWRETCHKQRLKYYRKTANAKNHHKPWTPEEIEIVMLHEVPDHMISKIIGRSVMSIQIARNRENKKRSEESWQTLKNTTG